MAMRRGMEDEFKTKNHLLKTKLKNIDQVNVDLGPTDVIGFIITG